MTTTQPDAPSSWSTGGATAAALALGLAATGAARATMLQRIPSYIAAWTRALQQPWGLRILPPLLPMRATRTLLRAYVTLVTATGPRLALGGGVALIVDGRLVRLGAARLWKRAMLAGVSKCGGKELWRPADQRRR